MFGFGCLSQGQGIGESRRVLSDSQPKCRMGCAWGASHNLIASSHSPPSAEGGQQEQMVKNERWKQRWEGDVLALVAAGTRQVGGCTLFPRG